MENGINEIGRSHVGVLLGVGDNFKIQSRKAVFRLIKPMRTTVVVGVETEPKVRKERFS